MNLALLRELKEYPALGFYEAKEQNLPWPRAYGLAMRRLYEHMPVRVCSRRLLTPFEPLYKSLTAEGNVMNVHLPHVDANDTNAHHTASFILNPFHSHGFEVQEYLLQKKIEQYPQHKNFLLDFAKTLRQDFPGRYAYIHSCPDIEQVLERGFDFYKQQIQSGLAAARAEGDTEGEQFLLTMQDYAAGIDAFYTKILQALTSATQEAEAASSPRATKLATVRDAFAQAFYSPAQSFVSGLLTINLLWMLDSCDSLGRIDLPILSQLFDQDLASGALTLELARELLDNLWEAFETFNGWNLQVGGYAPNGTALYSALTRECLLCDARNKRRRPNLALRVTKTCPDSILDLALDSILSGTGTPALYNDDRYIELLQHNMPELSPQDARRYGFGGCTETMVPGLGYCDSLAGAINLAQILGFTLHGGVDYIKNPDGEPSAKTLLDYATYEDFVQALEQNCYKTIDSHAANLSRAQESLLHSGDIKVARSMFTRGCLESRRGVEQGGARYNWSVTSFEGVNVVIDSLSALKHLVYDTQQVSRERLYAALQTDFANDEELRQLLLHAPKFGNDIAAADAPGCAFIEHVWGRALGHKLARGGRLLPSVISFQTYAMQGEYVPALPNGRHARQPLGDSISAFAGADTQGPTALIQSVLRLPQHLAPGTPVFNVRFSKDIAQSPTGREALKTLIRTYFAGGGLQMQITIVSTQELRAAQQDPEHHGDLIVRIGGYSEYFVFLSPALQETVIQRSAHRV